MIPRRVLSIGGSDPSSGAGIQADFFTLLDLKVFPYSVATSVTFQNSLGIKGLLNLSSHAVSDQLEAVSSENQIDAVKIGMLGSKNNVEAVSSFLRSKKLEKVVVDPVLRASSGASLLEEEAIPVLKNSLFPQALVVTPNLIEAETLVGFAVRNLAEMKKAAQAIFAFGTKWVLVKGGHLEGEKAIDLLFDGKKYYQFETSKLDKDVRGTGCIFASALAAYLAEGKEMPAAAKKAKDYVTQAIKGAYQLGKGRPQMMPF